MKKKFDDDIKLKVIIWSRFLFSYYFIHNCR